MLDPAEAAQVRERFGVDDLQVRRDHLLSHLLAALSRHAAERVIFFGGTALGRTHLTDVRLSEDLDLIAISRRSDVAELLERRLAAAVRREYGQLRWEPPLTQVRGAEPAVLVSPDGLTVRIQLLSGTGYEPWPTELRDLEHRYADAPPARLRVPTLPAFVAWKTVAWADRQLPRDLYDLWALAERGAIDAVARDLYVKHGPTGSPPAGWLFDDAPSESDWRLQLGGQTRLAIGPAEAASCVRAAWRTVASST
ncbi:MAG TPA: nucleotidyl transferase AbiEii/AbiGii toxin family protein [Nocardioidaceae bacterium]|nr:nucleotidyl transferase AbiEii/AbiGii toxin family protein [Nocardioidaceae bacterium]